MDKKSMRREIRERLKNIENRDIREKLLADIVADRLIESGFNRIAIYVSFGTEPDTSRIVSRLFEEGKKVFAPYLDADGAMSFAEINKNSKYMNNKFGIPEPIIRKPEINFDAIIVPVMAFDGDNARLGKGWGCYDKFLKTSKAEKIGIAFIEQKVDRVPTDEFDVRLDKIIFV